MLIKFETKSSRVKGLSFHSKRPWILASLHTGIIQLWDYQIGVLIDQFLEHDGPVRAVHFHPYQPLFASGGDDCKVKVWSHKSRKCLFTLEGHQDYIRTVEFHSSQPWICSASDDLTIRIWNFQSRESISTFSAHTHYIMRACFHPKEDLLASASLDQTVRVWDLGPLREKTLSPLQGEELREKMVLPLQGEGRGKTVLPLQGEGRGKTVLPLQGEGRGKTVLALGVEREVRSKFVMEGHERGVNWVEFHPDLPIIVTGGDDRVVKLWRMNDKRVWETDTIRGHTGNISCVLFHAKRDLIISNSEDKTIRFFDMTFRSTIKPFQREKDRFWILSLHPQSNLLAAGHDSGLMVFKLERERPAYFLSLETNKLYSVKDTLLRVYDLDSQQGKPTEVIKLKKPVSLYGNKRSPVALSYDKTGNMILLSYEDEEYSYDLYKNFELEGSSIESDKGLGRTAVFISRNRFAVLDRRNNEIIVKNLQNKVVNKYTLPMVSDFIYRAGTEIILCRNEEEVSVFDLSQLSETGKLTVRSVKYVSWSNDMKYVALLSKNSVVLASDKLVQFCTVSEAVRVKSGAWDEKENGVFIYNTLTHIKYCLLNGDNGIVQTLEKMVYIIKVVGCSIYCLDRDEKIRVINIDNSEYLFKLALQRQKHKRVMSMIKSSKFCGEAIVSYLEQKGFYQIGLHFTENEKSRFNLALKSGNLEIAVNSANEINEKDYWYRLSTEALKQGNVNTAEFSYQQTKNFEKLSFLYLITGNLEKLSKMVKIAEVKNDIMGQFHNLMYLGDITERVKVLEKSGHLTLAYVTALTHGMREKAASLASEMREKVPVPVRPDRYQSLLIPPLPITRNENWPLLSIIKDSENEKLGFGNEDEQEEEANEAKPEELEASSDKQNGEQNGWEMDGSELETEIERLKGESKTHFFVPPAGKCASRTWIDSSYIASDYVAAGSFKTAVQLLYRQVGIYNFAPLRKIFLDVYVGSCAYIKADFSVPVLSVPLQNPNLQNSPALIFSLEQLGENLNKAYRAFTIGKLNESRKLFLSILHTLPLVKVYSRKEVEEMKELIGIAREYSLGLKMEIKRKELKEDVIRQQELAAYFANCKLQKGHLRIVLSNAMSICYKNGNYRTAAHFARVLLQNEPSEIPANNARRIIDFQANGSKMDQNELRFDVRNPNFEVCGTSFQPIYKGEKDLNCAYCGAHFLLEFKGKVCEVCEIGMIGGEKIGLVCSPAQFGR